MLQVSSEGSAVCSAQTDRETDDVFVIAVSVGIRWIPTSQVVHFWFKVIKGNFQLLWLILQLRRPFENAFLLLFIILNVSFLEPQTWLYNSYLIMTRSDVAWHDFRCFGSMQDKRAATMIKRYSSRLELTSQSEQYWWNFHTARTIRPLIDSGGGQRTTRTKNFNINAETRSPVYWLLMLLNTVNISICILIYTGWCQQTTAYAEPLTVSHCKTCSKIRNSLILWRYVEKKYAGFSWKLVLSVLVLFKNGLDFGTCIWINTYSSSTF